jgi:hypothetical protein
MSTHLLNLVLGSSEEAQDHQKLENNLKRRSNWRFAALVAADRAVCTALVTVMGWWCHYPFYLEAGYSWDVTG